MLITDKILLKSYTKSKRVWQGIPSIEITKKGRIFVTFYSGGTKEEIGNYVVLLKSDDGIEYDNPVIKAKVTSIYFVLLIHMNRTLDNALKYGADEVYTPQQLRPTDFLNWDTWTAPDLTRNGHKVDIFGLGYPNVMEFTGTPSGLMLASDMVCAHGRFGIGGFHNDGDRTVDFKMWNMKAMDMINCHEKRIEFETDLCKRALDLISKGIWEFTGTVSQNSIYTMEEFDKANYEMENHTNNFIKGAVKCDD